jgi:ribonuclease-3
MQPEDMSRLEAALEHSFRNPELLEQALTHSSHAHEAGDAGTGENSSRRDNEQLEFLGDAVLGMVTSDALYQRFPEHREGELSKLRAHLVSARHLVSVSNTLALGSYLRLGRGEEKSGGRSKAALLVDALEAVLAALYLDGGLPAAQKFVVKHIVDPELERIGPGGVLQVTDYKSALQESVQSLGRPQPTYRVAKESGPDHKKTFTVELQLNLQNENGRPDYVVRGEGPSKKIAEQRAAQQALEHLHSQNLGGQPA